MSRLSVNEMQMLYPSSENRVQYFGIKNNGETKQVRFLYNTLDDIYFDVAHDVNINGRNQTIACLNSNGSNLAGCPLCAKGHNQSVKLYIPVLDLTDNKIKVWTRSKNFIAQIQALAARNNPISGAVLEITRIGMPRDPKTQYTIYPIAANDGNTVEALLAAYRLEMPDTSAMMRQMDFNQMQNFAITIDAGNAMPANFAPTQYGAPAPVYGMPTTPMMPQTPAPNMYAQPAPVSQPMYSNPAAVSAPVQAPVVGNAPVRRSPASVPTYESTMPTTPMQGVPTPPVNTAPVQPPVAPTVPVTPTAPTAVPVPQTAQTVSQGFEDVGAITDEDVPF